MDHAEVRERLEEAALVPGRLEELVMARDESDAAVVGHLDLCAGCRAESDALRATAQLLAAAAPDDLRAPDGARERLLERVRTTGRVREQAGGRRLAVVAERAGTPPRRIGDARSARHTQRRTLAGLAAAAGLVLLAGGGLLAREIITDRDAAAQQAAALGRVAVTTDLVLRDPDHRSATLTNATSQPSGTVLVGAGGQLVVVSDRLPEPPAGERYGCYIERDGKLVQIGYMARADALAFWIGRVDQLPDAGREGDRFVVTLTEQDTSPILVGDF